MRGLGLYVAMLEAQKESLEGEAEANGGVWPDLNKLGRELGAAYELTTALVKAERERCGFCWGFAHTHGSCVSLKKVEVSEQRRFLGAAAALIERATSQAMPTAEGFVTYTQNEANQIEGQKDTAVHRASEVWAKQQLWKTESVGSLDYGSRPANTWPELVMLFCADRHGRWPTGPTTSNYDYKRPPS